MIVSIHLVFRGDMHVDRFDIDLEHLVAKWEERLGPCRELKMQVIVVVSLAEKLCYPAAARSALSLMFVSHVLHRQRPVQEVLYMFLSLQINDQRASL
jgi:hypothetical protein